MKQMEEGKNLLALFLIVLLGLGLRLYHLDFFPLWGDEAFTRFYSECSLSYLWTTGFQLETNPPGYCTLMHAWMPLFGTSEDALRFPSVLASTLAIVLVYALGRELEGRAVGLIGALVMALVPIEIWYAQEARTYALLHLPIGVVLLSLAWFLLRPTSPGSLITYGFGAICAVYCHDTAVLLLAACNLAVFCAALGRHPLLTRRDLVRWLIANGVTVLVLFPLIVTMWNQRGSSNIQWIPPLTLSNTLANISEVLGGTAAHTEFPHGRQFLLLLALGLLLRPLRPLNRRTVTVLIHVPLFFIGLVVLFSLNHSVLLPRIFLWLWIPLSLLMAQVLTRKTRARWAVLAILLILFVPGLTAQLSPSYILKDDWRNFLAANREQLSRSDTIVLGPATQIAAMAYYFPDGIPRMKFWTGETPVRRDFEKTFMYEKFKIPDMETKDLLAAISSGRRVSLFLCPPDAPYLDSPSPVRPPDRRFDDILFEVRAFHLLSWNGDGSRQN